MFSSHTDVEILTAPQCSGRFPCLLSSLTLMAKGPSLVDLGFHNIGQTQGGLIGCCKMCTTFSPFPPHPHLLFLLAPNSLVLYTLRYMEHSYYYYRKLGERGEEEKKGPKWGYWAQFKVQLQNAGSRRGLNKPDFLERQSNKVLEETEYTLLPAGL